MRDKYTDSIRIGIVSSIDPDKGTAQVTFKDRGGIVSRDLHLNFMKTLEDYYYCMPDVGERVRCFFDPEAPTKGYIIGSYPSDTRVPPIKNKDKTYVLFKDKTLVEYDRDLHTLTIKIPKFGEKSIDIFTKSDINTECKETINTITNNSTIDYRVHDDHKPGAGEPTVKIKVFGNNGKIELTTTNAEHEKDTLKAEIDGKTGDVNISTTNFDTDNDTTEIVVKGQEGKIDLITKNFETGNETAFIKMDGNKKTIDVQGYVTVTGSHTVVPKDIPD